MRKGLIIGGIIVGAGLLLAGRAAADDDDDDGGGGGDLPPPPDEPDEPPPPPPGPNAAKNYVGSGWAWTRRDRFPNERAFGLALQQLGYPINPAAGNWGILSASSMSIVREFQRDYNLVRVNPVVVRPDDPVRPAISTDGLIGQNTIAALVRAPEWAQRAGMGWPVLVQISGG